MSIGVFKKMSTLGTLKAGRPSIAKGKEKTLASLADEPGLKRVNFQVPEDLHTKLKVYAASSGKTITEVLTEYIKHLPNK